MPGPLLYSANPWVKWHIQRNFRGDRHYVWCSEQADSRTAAPNSLAGLVPPTSNPLQIYKDLHEACRTGDTHNSKIKEIKTSYLSLTTRWVADGSLNVTQREEIEFLMKSGELKLWRPLLYVIPRDLVEARMQSVPPAKRAGLGPEYIIEDLAGVEFDTVEFT